MAFKDWRRPKRGTPSSVVLLVCATTLIVGVSFYLCWHLYPLIMPTHRTTEVDLQPSSVTISSPFATDVEPPASTPEPELRIKQSSHDPKVTSEGQEDRRKRNPPLEPASSKDSTKGNTPNNENRAEEPRGRARRHREEGVGTGRAGR